MQFDYWRSLFGRPPVDVSPYEAELFGHWWFEGPEFLDLLVRKIACDQRGYRLSSPTDVIESGFKFQVAMPTASSWGAYRYSDSWLNEKNDWIWPNIHNPFNLMAELARERQSAEGVELRALVASSSDWPFMITMGTTVPYAERRVRQHINQFNRLLAQVKAHRINEDWLEQLEFADNIFHNIDFHDFAPVISKLLCGKRTCWLVFNCNAALSRAWLN